MADAAYVLFFAAVLVASSAFTHVFIAANWARVTAAIRGEPFNEISLAPGAGAVSVVERPARLQPATINISRI